MKIWALKLQVFAFYCDVGEPSCSIVRLAEHSVSDEPRR